MVIKSCWLHVKALKMEKIVKTKEIIIEINEIFECRWNANVHLKLLTIFTDISELKNHLGIIKVLEIICLLLTIFPFIFN